ncbi:MAG: molybdopterin-dependent oxidoreductase [Chloroflexi bacterium]|nr:molybdopterin-dependent oxidoreductase [Chloroflexota bacterium]
MKEITLSINEKQVKGKEGDTVLDVCRANDIYLPTLCHLEGLTDVGACRMCVVEIEKERRPIPACTYPARDGLVVRTHTEKLEKYRRQILELLFTERNHFCFFCAASGECELQGLAYRYQMDHARYPYTFPALPTDTLSDFLVLDHNRCILCGRCVRICSEVVGNHTLDFARRGWRTAVTADLDQPLGESSCITCGACIQACPTGALFSKVSAYRGRATEGEFVRSICSLCSVGCDINVLVKDNNIVRIDGADLTGLKGQLCVKGRFRQVYRENPRIVTPLIARKRGVVRPASWEEALNLVATELKAYLGRYGAGSIAGLVSSRCPNETVEAFAKFMRDTVGTSFVDTLDGNTYRTLLQGATAFGKDGQGLEIESPLEAILEADCVLVVGANLLESHPVAGCYILRARTRNRARLLVIEPRQNDLGVRADLWLRPAEDGMETVINALTGLVAGKGKRTGKPRRGASIAGAARDAGVDEALLEQAAEMLRSAQKAVVVYGEGILNKEDPKLVASLLELANLINPGGLKVTSLKPGANSRGAWESGAASQKGLAKVSPRLVYVLLSDDEVRDGDWLAQAEQAEFLVVQASYASPLTEAADLVLPSPIWAERAGTYVSLDGRVGRSQAVLEPLPGLKDDKEIIQELAHRL